MTQNYDMTSMTKNYWPSFMHSKNGNTTYWVLENPLKSNQTTKIYPTSENHVISMDNKHDGMNTYRNSTSSSNIYLAKQTQKQIYCQDYHGTRRRYLNQIRSKSLKKTSSYRISECLRTNSLKTEVQNQ